MTAPEPLIYTMRELNQQTARIMAEIAASGKPAFITKLGRFTAMITPLNGEIESRVLTEMARELAGRGA